MVGEEPITPDASKVVSPYGGDYLAGPEMPHRYDVETEARLADVFAPDAPVQPEEELDYRVSDAIPHPESSEPSVEGEF